MARNNNTPSLPRSLRLGIIALVLIVAAWALAAYCLPSFLHKADTAAPSEKAWTQWKEANGQTSVREGGNLDDGYENSGAAYAPVGANYRPVAFDPNTASYEVLLQVGFPERTARTIIKYRNKGGKFRTKEALLKLYNLPQGVYEKVAPYVQIADEFKPQTYTDNKFYNNGSPKEPAMVELNSVDTNGLIALRGIGPGYARRIINFREKLGGFYSVEQVGEVYGFPDSTYQQLKGKFKADPAAVRKININTATEEQLANHAYIGKKMAANILALRKDLQQFSDLEQLRQVPYMNEERFRKIIPYLSTH
ncbi:MAG: helix-hairpin-helix domain-containing protein [Edaphocola sp.]